MTTSDTTVNNLIINTMTQQQYDNITPSDTELYMITDSVLSSTDVTDALGYTPYNGTTNPNGYTSNVGTVTSVNNVSPVNGNVTISIPDAQVQSNWNETDTNSKAYIQNKPTIPTVNDATLTIQKNSTTVETFSANASSNVTCNITVPIDLGDLTNNAGYTKNTGTVTSVNNVAPVNGNVSLTIPTVPTTDQSFSKTSTNPQSGTAVLDMLKTIYPVGSVYLSTNSTCPLASLFGTWSLVSSGRALWTGAGSNGGSTISAGLPNITGGLIIRNSTADAGLGTKASASGAFQLSQTGTGKKTFGDSSGTYTVYQPDFNASRSSSIYGNSTTVQPPAYIVNVWKRTA